MASKGVDPPAARLLSRRFIGRDEASGAMVIAYVATADFTNRHGTVQGGFLAAMLDSATAYALLAELPERRSAVTKRLEIDFQAPARPGDLIASVTVVARDLRRATVEATLRDARQAVVAKARAELRIVSRQ